MSDAGKLVEAMAQAMCDAWMGAGVWAAMKQKQRLPWRRQATTALEALRAALPDLGLRVVLVKATEEMSEGFNSNCPAIYAAFLAAAPDPLAPGGV